MSQEITLAFDGDGVTLTLSNGWELHLVRGPAQPLALPPVPDKRLASDQRPDRAKAVAKLARTRRPTHRRGPKPGPAYRKARARGRAIRAFADADPRFTRADYRSDRGSWYVKKHLQDAFNKAEAEGTL